MMGPFTAAMLDAGVKVGLLVAVGLLAVMSARRAPAAWRYQLWFGIGLGLLVIPFVIQWGPGWQVPGMTLAAAPAAGEIAPPAGTSSFLGSVRVTEFDRPSGTSPDWTWDGVIFAVLAAGTLWQCLRVAAEIRFWRRCRRRASPAEPGPKVALPGGIRVGYAVDTRLPVLVGWWRPMILLPAAAREWPDSTRAMVVRHEWAHFQRGDHWGQLLTVALRLVYWWHPGAWLLLRRLRIERETACDDAVLRSGVKPSEYARALLRVVRAARGAGAHPIVALAMASGAPVGPRVEAVLAAGRNRRAAGWTVGGVILLAALTLAGILGSARMATEPPRESPAPPVAAKAPLPGAAADADGLETVEVTATFLEVAETDYRARKAEFDRWVHAANVAAFERLPGSNLLTAPSTIVRRGQASRIQVGREFRYPVQFERTAGAPVTPVRFQTENLGLMFDFTADRVGDRVQVHGIATMRAFEGFTEGDEGVRVPTFITKEANIFRVIPSDRTVGFWLPGLGVPGMNANAESYPMAPPPGRTASRMAVFLAVRIRFIPRPPFEVASRNPPARNRPRVQAAARPTPTPANLPSGTPVAGKPGYITSPYAPRDGYVDVRGFPPNTEVKCPYSGKVFLVP